MLTGAVLSGGTSTRFGQEKGLVAIDGKPMIALVVATMRAVADEVVVAVARGRGARYSRALGGDVIVVEDEREGLGPLLGLVTALRASSGEYVVVSPCDTPLLNSGVCRVLAGRGMGRDGAVPRIRGYLEPLHASYRRDRCLRAFERTVAGGIRRPKDAYSMLDLAIVEEGDIREVDPHLASFINVNTREELSQVVARLSENRGSM